MSEKNRDSGAESGRDSVPAPAAGPTGTGPIIDLTELVVRGDAALDVAAQAEHAPETDTVGKIPDTAPLPSPLLAGMLPGLVERVSGLAHDLDVVRDKMEQISLRQNRIDQAQRRAASLGTCLPHAEELALLVTPMLDPLNARITALEGALEDRDQDHAAGTGKEGAAQDAAQQSEEGSCDISGISTRLNECEEQLALCVTRADLEQTCTAILDKHLPAAFEELAQAASGREADRTETADMEDQTGQLMNQSAHQRLDDISSRLQALENGLAAQADMAEAQCSEKLPEDMAEAVAAAEADTVTDGCASAQPGQAQATALLAEHEAMFEGRLTALETSLAGVEEGLGELAAKLARGLEDLDSLSGRMQAVESSLASVLARDAAAAASEKNEAEDIAALAVRLDSLESWRAEEAVLREGLAESLADRAQELAALRRDAAGAGEGLVRRLDALEDTLAALTAAQEADQAAAGESAQNGAGEDLARRLQALEDTLAALTEAQEAEKAAVVEAAQNAAGAEEGLARRLQALEDRLAALTEAQEAARDAAQAAAVEAAQSAAGAEESLARRLEALEDRLAAVTAAQEAAREAEKTAEAVREAGQAAASPASLELLDKLAERQAGQDAELAALRESQTSARNSLNAVQETLSSKCDVLASRMAALEELLGEEHLERVAARACIRVLREEIASIMQAGK